LATTLQRMASAESIRDAAPISARVGISGCVAALRKMTNSSGEPEISSRAAAIVKGLVRTKRAAKGVTADQGTLRIVCLKGGYYWVSLDGSRVLRGSELFAAEELQPKFIDAIERAGH